MKSSSCLESQMNSYLYDRIGQIGGKYNHFVLVWNFYVLSAHPPEGNSPNAELSREL